MTIGSLAVVVCVVMVVIALGLPDRRISYYPDVVVPHPHRFALFVCAAVLGNLGVLMISLGYVVRAIAFLPGREDAAPVATDASVAAPSDGVAQE